MVDTSKLQGKKLTDLFQGLVQNRSIISVSVAGLQYERLTCVTGIRQVSGREYLSIARPDGLEKAASDSGGLNLQFTFNGPDKLEYLFSTKGGKYLGLDVEIPFPDYVERLQRRRDFRVVTTAGTHMLFKSKKLCGMIDVINVSMGGLLGIIRKHNQKGAKEPLLKMDQHLYKLGIFFQKTEDRSKKVVVIEKARVCRIEKDENRNICRYALKFLDLKRQEHAKLTQCIYGIQRDILKRR
ncbi:MAG: hypothetical protein GY874_04695 [Desulfobacteraceae bacterium]|nr:hypothetical protein [Desulfobacteraceae bacterium]